MEREKRRRAAWLIALGMTGVLYAFIALKMDVRFGMNDDAIIQRALMGYENGTPASFHLYLHGLLVWPIFLLHSLFPLIPWYACALLALLFLSLTVIAKSLMQVFDRCQKPLWAGAVLAAAFLIAFGLEYTAQPTFTYTAALLGAAAVAQLFSIDFDRASRWQIILGMLGAAGLVSLCYAVRLDAPLPSIAYCGLAFVFLFWEHFGFGKKAKRSARPMVISLLVIAAVLIGMAGVRQIEVAFSGSDRYIEWHNERSEALDYRGLSNVPDDALAEAGWDETTLRLAQNWCFLDGDISTEALRTINDALEAQDSRTFTDRLRQAKRLILNRVDKSAYAFQLLAVGLIAGAAAFIGSLFMPGRRLRRWFALGFCAAGFGVMLIYLALQGRLPMRAVSAISVPAVVLAFAMLPLCMPGKRLLSLLTAALLVFSLVSVRPVYRLCLRSENAVQPGQALAELESYAAQHPESLFIADGTFSADDVRAFPSYPDGLPMNISYWGGWDMRSPSSEQLFERFGLDVWNIGAQAFLREDVFFASTQETPPQILLDWLGRETGHDVGWDAVAKQGGVYILHFRA